MRQRLEVLLFVAGVAVGVALGLCVTAFFFLLTG